MKKALLFAGGAVVGAALLGVPAQAAILNVDFNGTRAAAGPTYTGNGVLRADGTGNTDPTAGTTSGIWNGVDVPGNGVIPTVSYVDSSGNPTGVTVTNNNGFTFSDNYNTGPYGNQSLLQDYIGGGTTGTITVSGLPAGPHDFYVYASNDGAGAGAIVTVNGVAAGTSNGGNAAIFSGGVNYVEAPNVSANALGNYVITTSDTGVGVFVVNGFQVSGVPEPTSAALLGLSSLGLLVRRRRFN